MKKHQTGEVLVAMMMLAVVLFSRGHMDMMGHGSEHSEQSGHKAQQAETKTAPATQNLLHNHTGGERD